MKGALSIGGALALLVGVATCLVDRKSSEYSCTEDSDCAAFDGARVCNTSIGYCVEVDCPDVCNAGCDARTRECRIVCDIPAECGVVECPPDWSCTIACSANNACSGIDCGGARACDITCSTRNACRDIDCGTGDTACTVACTTGRACDDIDCARGRCEVTCTGGWNACGIVDCHDACACDVACSTDSCSRAICTDLACEAGAGCSSEQADCQACP